MGCLVEFQSLLIKWQPLMLPYPSSELTILLGNTDPCIDHYTMSPMSMTNRYSTEQKESVDTGVLGALLTEASGREHLDCIELLLQRMDHHPKRTVRPITVRRTTNSMAACCFLFVFRSLHNDDTYAFEKKRRVKVSIRRLSTRPIHLHESDRSDFVALRT